MKLCCNKCDHVLTKDLYPHKHLYLYDKFVENYGTYVTDDGEEVNCTYVDRKYEIKKGTFMNHGNYYIANPNSHGYQCRPFKTQMSVNFDDCIGIEFEQFKSGNGCCDNHYIDVRCNSCKTIVGIEFSDCYDVKAVELYKEKIYRSYK